MSVNGTMKSGSLQLVYMRDVVCRDAPSSSRSSLATSVIYEMLELDPEMFNITIQPEIDTTRDLLTELKGYGN